jgi:hypothetical protein
MAPRAASPVKTAKGLLSKITLFLWVEKENTLIYTLHTLSILFIVFIEYNLSILFSRNSREACSRKENAKKNDI